MENGKNSVFGKGTLLLWLGVGLFIAGLAIAQAFENSFLFVLAVPGLVLAVWHGVKRALASDFDPQDIRWKPKNPRNE